jgi:hypothetical protein
MKVFLIILLIVQMFSLNVEINNIHNGFKVAFEGISSAINN